MRHSGVATTALGLFALPGARPFSFSSTGTYSPQTFAPCCAATSRRNSATCNNESFQADDISLLDSMPDREFKTSTPSKGDISELDLSLSHFIDMMDKAPPGTLQTEEIRLLREMMASITEENEGHVDTMERLLYRMISEWGAATQNMRDDRIILLEPKLEDFLLVFKAWQATLETTLRSKTSSGKLNTKGLSVTVERVWRLFATQKSLFENGLESVKPDQETFRTVLSVFSVSRDRGMDRKVWSLFEAMQSSYDVEPDESIYNFVIRSLAKSRQRGAAERAENLLREAVKQYPPWMDVKGRVRGMSVESFNVVLTAWAKSGLDYGAERAEKLIIFMDEVDSANGSPGTVKPNISSFTSLIDAYAQQSEWDGVAAAERILNRILDFYLEGEAEFQPSIATWTIVLSGWSRLSRKGNRGAASRADRLLKRIESLHQEGRIEFEPDAIAYVTVMNAFCSSKTPDGPPRGEDILDEMNERFMDGDDSMRPSAKSVRMVIDAWVKSNGPGCMEKAERVLDRYEDHLASSGPPDEPHGTFEDTTEIYKILLFGWAKNGDPERAQDYLLDMVDKNMQLDSFCFDKVIEANTFLNGQDSLQRSTQVFELLEKARKTGTIKPNERVYTSYIRAIAKARVPDVAEKADAVLQRMQDLFAEGNRGIEPTVFTYNAVLMACSETPNTEKASNASAFKIALRIFNEVRGQRRGPDHVTFGNMLRCTNLVPKGDQKDKLVKATFQLCCKTGWVNSFVLRDLRDAASAELLESLFSQSLDSLDVEQLPASWQRQFANKRR